MGEVPPLGFGEEEESGLEEEADPGVAGAEGEGASDFCSDLSEDFSEDLSDVSEAFSDFSAMRYSPREWSWMTNPCAIRWKWATGW